jgi:hypothetical protein
MHPKDNISHRLGNRRSRFHRHPSVYPRIQRGRGWRGGGGTAGPAPPWVGPFGCRGGKEVKLGRGFLRKARISMIDHGGFLALISRISKTLFDLILFVVFCSSVLPSSRSLLQLLRPIKLKKNTTHWHWNKRLWNHVLSRKKTLVETAKLEHTETKCPAPASRQEEKKSSSFVHHGDHPGVHHGDHHGHHGHHG